MIKRNSFILFILLIVSIISCVGCGSIENTIKNETCSSVQDTQANNSSTIYISSVSKSAHIVDRYSLTKNGDLSKDSIAFDNNCKYYNNLNQQISFDEFTTIIYNSNLQSNSVKCNIITSNKLIIETYLTE